MRLDALVMGEALWDLVTPAGMRFSDAPRLDLRIGGGAANVALHLAAAGLRVGLATTASRDALGDAFVARLERCGVDVRLVARTAGRMGLAFAEAAPPRFVTYRPAEEAELVAPDRVDARLLVLSGLTPERRSAFEDAAARARASGARVVLDVNARPRMWRGRELTAGDAPLLDRVDVWKASDEDLRTAGVDERALETAGPSLRLVTRGAGLASAFSAEGRVDRAPADIDASPDAMGAGDAFTAAIAEALLGPMPSPDQLLARAHAGASAFLRRRRQER